jgi:hypothetical protein
MGKTNRAADGLRMMAREFRKNAERSVSLPQREAFSGRAAICDGAANEIDRLRKALSDLLEAPDGELHTRTEDNERLMARAAAQDALDY